MELPAEFLWDIMIDGAYQNGEPGIFHYDWTNQDHTFAEGSGHDIEATNPCLTGDTLVNTPGGLVRAENVKEGDEISTVYGSEIVDEKLVFEDSEVYRVTLSDGGVVKATEDHRFHFLDGNKSIDDDTPLRDLSEGDKIRLEPTKFEKEGSDSQYKYQLRRGILVGDGGYTQATIDQNNRLSISSSEDDKEYNENVRELFEQAGYNVGELDTSGRNKSVKLWIRDAERVLSDHNLDPEYSHEKSVDVTDYKTQAEAQGFLDGLLATDGSISMSSNRPQIRWATSSEELAQNVRHLALNAGMHARIYEDKRKSRGGERKDGSAIKTKNTLYNIHVAGESADTFVENTRLQEYHPDKGERLDTLRTDYMLTGGLWKASIDNIEKVGKKTVYDLYCSGSDTWVTEGYVNRGCAEQPLAEHEACNLGHINLSLMLEEDAATWDEFNGPASTYVQTALDTEQFGETIETATRFLEDVVTQSDFPLEEIEKKVGSLRKIGVGVMGMAQMLYQMGVPYDSEVGRDICAEVLRIINRETAVISSELARERGAFDAYEESKWANPTDHPEWFARHTGALNAANYEDGLPVRNHNQTTIAPTGTTSMIGDTSGGCEPVYSVAFYKNVGGDIQQGDFLVEFDSYFLRTLEANDIDVEAVKAEAETQMENDNFDGVNGLTTVPDEFGDVFVTTEQIAPEDHTLMQRRLQEHVDSGISKTINMPAAATREDIGSAYKLALSGDDIGQPAKGVTVYRDGSRDEQVKSTSGDMSEAGSESGMDAQNIESHLEDLYQSDAIGDEAMGVLATRLNADIDAGEEVRLCPECEDSVMQMQEGCTLCTECGFSPCS